MYQEASMTFKFISLGAKTELSASMFTVNPVLNF